MHAHTHTHEHTSPRGSASLVICFPSTQEGERIPCRWDESNGIILKCIPPPHSTVDWGGLCAAFMKCLMLLSGKGTVNVTSSVSAITAHTGTGRPGKEGRVWPAHVPAVPAVNGDQGPRSPVQPVDGAVKTIRDGEGVGDLETLRTAL